MIRTHTRTIITDPYFYRRHKGFLGYPDILRIRGSVIPNIFPHVLLVTVFATVICMLYMQWGYTGLAINSAIIPSISVVLGLLVAMRTNTAYDRYWEGRKLWSQVQTNTRLLVRNIWLGVPSGSEEQGVQKRRAIELVILLVVAIKERVRCALDVPIDADVIANDYKPYHDSTMHLPLELSYRVTQYVINLNKEQKIDGAAYAASLNLLASQMDALAQMDRIRATPIPLAYLIHMKQAITAYCFVLPFTMVSVLHYLTIPLVALVAFLLFGIDGIGAEIENPFGVELNDLPIDYLCHEMAKEAEYIETHIPTSATLEQALGVTSLVQ